MRVRLYQRARGIWWASWTARGSTVRRSTRTADEAKARAVVDSWSDPPEKRYASEEWGVVYFVEAVGSTYVKIGWTRTGMLEQRVAALQTGSPHALRVVATMPGRMLEEHREHARFQADWVRGEWFRASTALLDRLRELHANP